MALRYGMVPSYGRGRYTAHSIPLGGPGAIITWHLLIINQHLSILTIPHWLHLRLLHNRKHTLPPSNLLKDHIHLFGGGESVCGCTDSERDGFGGVEPGHAQPADGEGVEDEEEGLQRVPSDQPKTQS
jgi:hypothetical protein